MQNTTTPQRFLQNYFIMPYKNIEERKRHNALCRRERVKKQRLLILEILGNKCVKCEFEDQRALAIDHINSGGNKERNAVGGAYYSYVLAKLKVGSNEYQLLCFNCNQIKRIETDEERVRKY